jgi:ankyrin repeat protein
MPKDNQAYHSNMCDAVRGACIYGRLDVARYLLETHHIVVLPSSPTMHPDAWYEDHTPLGIAIRFGHHDLVDVLLKFGAELQPKHLVCAIERQNGPSFPMVRHLIDAGCIVSKEAVRECRNRATLQNLTTTLFDTSLLTST